MRQITDRFLAAVKLCVGAEPVKQRLAKAWITELEDIGISELPEQLRPDFRRLREAMSTAAPLPHESAAAASIRKMSAHQANHQTLRILTLSQELMRISFQAETALQAGQTEDFYLQGMPAAERLN
jgi:hypothetical protein